MAGIPMSALRRALAEMAESKAPAAFIPGGIAGGAIGTGYGALSGHDDEQIGQDAMMGAGIGAGLGLAGAGSVFSGKLRQALAESAAERGIGRAAAREASHVDDAARFGEAMAPRRTPSHMTPKADVMLRMLHDNPNITDEELGLAVWGDDIRAGLVDEDTAIALVPRYRERLAAAGQWNPQ